MPDRSKTRASSGKPAVRHDQTIDAPEGGARTGAHSSIPSTGSGQALRGRFAGPQDEGVGRKCAELHNRDTRARCVSMESSLRGAERRSNPENVGRPTFPGLLRFARNDAAGSTEMQLALAEPVERDRVVDQDAIADRFVG